MDSTVTVQEVMDREFVGVSESDTVSDTAELMLSEARESVVVLRGSEPLGLLTQRDALEALVRGDDGRAVADAMRTSVPTVTPQATITEAADEMSARGTQRLVVTDGDGTVGLLSEHDLVAASPLGPGTDAGTVPDPTDAGTVPDPTAAAQEETRTDAAPTVDQGFEDQSICEACGSLARDLATFNGQLLCGDCRDI